MKNWNFAINKFLEGWKGEEEFEGALLTGSFAVGSQSASSDIDIMIVLSDKTECWQRSR